MDRLTIPNRDMIDSLRDNPDLRYAAKYPVESHLGFRGIWQCDQYRYAENMRPEDTVLCLSPGLILERCRYDRISEHKPLIPIRNPETGAFLVSGGYREPRNTFTTEGMARLLNIIFHDISKAASEIWYVGIFKNNVTPAVGNTAAVCLGAAGTYGECQDADYDSPATDKPQYTTADTATASITNSVAGKAEFTIAATITVYGAFLSTEKAKTATTGYLMCGKKFTSSRAVIDDDILYVTYTISATTS